MNYHALHGLEKCDGVIISPVNEVGELTPTPYILISQVMLDLGWTDRRHCLRTLKSNGVRRYGKFVSLNDYSTFIQKRMNKGFIKQAPPSIVGGNFTSLPKTSSDSKIKATSATELLSNFL